jgi:hypothetical protein
LGNEIYYIPLAFGYIWEEPIVANITGDIEDGMSIIGLIRDDRGTRTFFRDSTDGGRIQVRLE